MRSSNSTPNKRRWGEGQDFQKAMIRVSVMRLYRQEFLRLTGGLGSLNQTKTQLRHIQIRAAARNVLQLSAKFLGDKLEPIRVMRTLRQPGAKLEFLLASVLTVQAQRVVLDTQRAKLPSITPQLRRNREAHVRKISAVGEWLLALSNRTRMTAVSSTVQLRVLTIFQ